MLALDGTPGFVDPVNNNFYLTLDSDCIDHGTDNPTFTDPDGTRRDIGPYYYPQLFGTHTEDFTLDGVGTITSSCTFQAGATLTLLPGSKLYVNPGVILALYGDFNAVGTVDQPIEISPADAQTTETQYWIGIQNFENNVNIHHLTVKNGYYGLYLNRSIGSISNVTLTEDYYGMYLYLPHLTRIAGLDINNCSNIGLFVNTVSPKLNIENSTITANKYGAALYNYSGLLRENTITDNQYDGLSFYSQSTGDMTTFHCTSENPPPENNHFNDNGRYGLNIYTGSFPLMGTYLVKGSRVSGGYNYLSRGTGQYVAYNHNSSEIDARVNWWTSFASLGPFSEFPTVEEVFGLKKGTIATDNDSTYEQLLAANTLFVDSLYAEALAAYTSILDEFPDDSLGVEAFSGVIACFNVTASDSGFSSFLTSIAGQYPGTLVGISATDYLTNLSMRSGDLDEALALNEMVLTAYEDMPGASEAYANALFKQSVIYDELAVQAGILLKSSETTQYKQKSVACTDKILGQYETTDVANLVRILNGRDEVNYRKPLITPAEFSLSPAYPNPFNPVTTLSFDLPTASQVQLVIYDIQGREVTRLINDRRAAGTYTTQWQGRDESGRVVASGLYFYTLEAVAAGSDERFRASRKILLLK